MSTSGNPTALPNFAQLFTADPTYKNFMGLNQQFNELTNAFGRGNSPFSLQDIQGAASAFQQAIQPYAQQFQERSGQEVLAQRAAAQQQQQQQLRSQMQNALGPGAVIQGNVTAPVSPLNQSPTSLAAMGSTANTRTAFGSLANTPRGASSYGSVGTGGGFGGNQNVIPLEGRFGLVRLARGGEVSEARRMLQNLQNPVQRFADGNEVKKTSVDQAAQDFIKATGAVNPAQAQSRAELDAMIAANAPARERALADPLSAYNSEFQTQFLPRALAAGLTAQQALEKYAQDTTAAFGTSVRYPSNNTVMPQLQGFIDAVNSGNAGDATKFASRAGMLGVGYNDFLDMAEAASPGIGSTMYKKFYDPNSEFSKQGKTFWPDLANLFQGGSPNPWSVIKEIKPKTGLTDEQIGYALGITGDDVKNAFQGKLVTLPSFGGAQAGGTQTGGTQAGGTQTGGTQTGSTTSAVTILPPTTALPELTSKFTQEVAPPSEAPPPALTPGQEGLNPSTAIVGAIPQSERVTTPQLDTEFRASAPRTAIYDRFGRITGYNYSPAAKLTAATGTNVFNFVPPGITSRPRSLLNLGDVPGVTVDPVTGQMRLPLSASQQFARDRSELDTAIRELYRRKSATDSSVPSTIPAPAAEAFRQLAMTDPSLSKQIRYRDISQDVYDPTKADASLRAQFGRPQAEAALTKAFDPFFERNRTALTSLAKDITASKTYSEMYPDIAAAYDKLSAAEKAKFPTLQDYERYHFDTYGKNEGRVSPLELMAKANPLRGPYTTPFFSKGGEASTEDFIKKQSGGDVSRGTASPETRKTRLPSGVQRAVSKAQESRTVVPVPGIGEARQFMSGFIGAQPDYSVMDPNYKALGSAYRTGEQTSVAADVFGALTPFATASALSKASKIPGIAELIAYHGSPHKFKKFDASKIGTGEGAQSYGHGLYFAENPKVAKEYAINLANRDLANQGRLNAHANAKRLATLAGDPKYAADDIRSVLELNPKHEQAGLLKATLEMLESGDYAKPLKTQGSLYTVDIPDEKIAQMLDWDKPLSQQPKAVQEFAKSKDPNLASKEPHFLAPSGEIFHWTELLENVDQLKDKKMREMSPKIFGGGEWVDYGDYLLSRTTGGDFYRSLSAPSEWSKQASIGAGRTGFDDVETSALLREAGIPGIQYLDQASRDAKQGTRNFVVFPGEEQNIKMLDINGEPLEKQDGGEVTTEEFIKKNVSRGTSEDDGERKQNIKLDSVQSLQDFLQSLPKGPPSPQPVEPDNVLPDVALKRKGAKELESYINALNPRAQVFDVPEGYQSSYRSSPFGLKGSGLVGSVPIREPDRINVLNTLTPGQRERVLLHEAEHSMSLRGGDIEGELDSKGRPIIMDNAFRAVALLKGNELPVREFVKNVALNKDKIDAFFGEPSFGSEFKKQSYEELRKRGRELALFEEQLASLSALEQATGKFLTQDKEMRKLLFPNTEMMSIFDALTGPRQTRMDARDLPPHTPMNPMSYETGNAISRFIAEKTRKPLLRELPEAKMRVK